MSTPDSPATARDQILEAAEKLFARKGFDPTTIKEIGTAANLNPALLYYYFGNKEELYQAVLERLVHGLVVQGGAALDRSIDPREGIRGLVAAQTEYLVGHPAAAKLFMREMVDHDARRAESVILQVAAGLFSRLCELIERGQKDGVFRRDVEPRFAAISTIAQVVYFTIARPAVGIFFGLGAAGVPESTARDFSRHAGEFAVRALSPVEKSA